MNDLETDTLTKTFVVKIGVNGALLDSGAQKAIVGKKFFNEHSNENELRCQMKSLPQYQIQQYRMWKFFFWHFNLEY